jgi:hypothetical protein
MSILSGIGGETLTGNWPGYVLTFHRVLPGGVLNESASLVLHSDEYEGEIELNLCGGLDRLGNTIVLSGLTDAHHQMLTARTGSGSGAPALAAMRVHLFWRDANRTVGGYLASLAGGGGLDAVLGAGGAGLSLTHQLEPFRIADLTITGVGRRRGTRRYETVLTGVERVRARTTVPLPEAVSVTGLRAAAIKLAELAGIQVKPGQIVPADPAKVPDDLPFTAPKGQPVRAAFARLGERIELVTGLYGRGMLLIRDGVLYVGPRAIPLGHDPWPLDGRTGLLSVEALPQLAADGTADPESDGPPTAAPAAPGTRRGQWKILLRGRPEIKPGHVVTFVPPPGESTVEPGLAKALLGSFAALGGDDGTPPLSGYVNAVRHTVNRSTGFLTELTVVVLVAGEDGWDRHTTPTTSAEAKGSGDKKPDRPDAAGALGQELDRKIAERVAAVEIAEVGEVRAARAAAQGPRANAQRLILWQGTTPAADGDTAGAVRLPIERAMPLEKSGVPYATPFAWGKCGLVLPRYPGMRVLSLYRHGLAEDPVEVGALWPAGQGPDAQPGDWWLSLPVGVPAQQRSAAGHDEAPTPHSGAVSNDLVDADGHRVIEVANLRVRIGQDGLAGAGTRPAPAPDDTLLSIEHSDGTTLVTIDSSGNVQVVAKGTLRLQGDGITLDAGQSDIELTANNVKVQVQNQMTVE